MTEGVPEVQQVRGDRGRRRQAQRHLTEFQAAEIVAEYEAGKTVGALAVKYKVDDKTVLLRLQRAGVELRPVTHGIPDSELEKVLALRDEGWSYHRIGEWYGRSGTAIRKYLLRHDALEAHAAR